MSGGWISQGSLRQNKISQIEKCSEFCKNNGVRVVTAAAADCVLKLSCVTKQGNTQKMSSLQFH